MFLLLKNILQQHTMNYIRKFMIKKNMLIFNLIKHLINKFFLINLLFKQFFKFLLILK